jgi:diguanylate cyclase (GGDEF)-like protein
MSVSHEARTKRMAQLLLWMLPTVFGFAMVLSVAAWMLSERSLAFCAAVAGGYELLLGMAYRALRRGSAYAAAYIVGASTLVAILALTIAQPALYPSNALVPLLVAVVWLQYAPEQHTRGYLLVCGAAVVVILGLGITLHGGSTLLPGLLLLLQISLLLTNVSFALFLLYQFSRQLRETLAQSEGAKSALEEHNAALARLGALGERLQTCQTRQEAHAVLTSTLAGVLPHESGVLYLVDEPSGPLRAAVSWGAAAATMLALPPDMFLSHADGPNNQAAGAAHLWHAPLQVGDDMFGMLRVRVAPGQMTAPEKQFIGMVARQCALALANIALRESLHHQAIVDPLTGLYNRRYLSEAFAQLLQRAQRQQTPISILLFDVDHFKRVNDTYGHAAGDMILQQIGAVLRAHLRASDVACRYGGEELLVLLPDAGSVAARHKAEILHQAIQELSFEHHEHTITSITVSIGVSTYPEHGSTTSMLLHAADAALYYAKGRGRNRIEAADDALQNKSFVRYS